MRGGAAGAMIRRLALALSLAAAAAGATWGAPRLELDARIVWSETTPGFGGFSGIEVQEDGTTFVAISDRGTWARGRLERADGRLTGATIEAHGPLRGVDGAPLGGENVDAEGLAADGAGGFYVSFEAFHRVRRYDRIEAAAAAVPSHPDFARLQTNSGLEALAADADGVLYAIPERSGALERPYPVYRLRDGVWDRALSLPRQGAFLVAGADFGPDGRLYLLERDFAWLAGFATRVRRFNLGPEGFDAGETLLETGFGSPDNFEGLSVWRDPEGATRVTLIADDNFFALQSTAIAEYLLVEG
jgi:hypothetical protein